VHIARYKGCKRCGGDLYLERDHHGAYLACLQCGALHVVPDNRLEKIPVPVRLSGGR